MSMRPNPYANGPENIAGMSRNPYRNSPDSPENRMPPPVLSRQATPGEIGPTSSLQYRVRKRTQEYRFITNEIQHFLNNLQLLSSDSVEGYRLVLQRLQRNTSTFHEEAQMEQDIKSMLRSIPKNLGPADVAVAQSKLDDQDKYRREKTRMLDAWATLLRILGGLYTPQLFTSLFGANPGAVAGSSQDDVFNWLLISDWEYAQIEQN